MELNDERVRLVSDANSNSDSRRLTRSMDANRTGTSFQESEKTRKSIGKITETREAVDSGERQKVTYVLQASGRYSPSESLRGSNEEITDDKSDISHCHTNAVRNSMDNKARKKLILAIVLCLFFMIGEMVGGFLAHSLAIISDAAHLLTDLASFLISLMALYLANRPATKRLSFGWHRAEILGAFVSILMLWVLTGILAYEAVERVRNQNFEINGTVMLITAATGVAFNILLGTTLHQHSHSHGGGSHGHSHGSKATSRPSVSRTQSTTSYGAIKEHDEAPLHDAHAVTFPDEAEHKGDEGEGHGHSHGPAESNINVKAAFVHVLGDLLQSIGVLAAAFVIYFKPEWKLADPICTFIFSLIVLVTTITIMKDIVLVLMEAAPKGLSFTDVQSTLLSVDSVLDIHNLRLWSLTMDKIAISAHLAVDKDCNPHDVLKAASSVIRQNFSVSEITFQIEEYVTDMKDCHDCQGPNH